MGTSEQRPKSFRAKEPLGARFFMGQGWSDTPISKSEDAGVWKIKAMQAEKDHSLFEQFYLSTFSKLFVND